MTPVDQQFEHRPDVGYHGDCMRACIAALLDLPITDVPHFAHLDALGNGDFWPDVAAFCRSHGYAFVTVEGRFLWADEPVYHIISGPSPRQADVNHAVIGCNGQVFHDPHPSRAGLAGDPSEWRFDFLVRP